MNRYQKEIHRIIYRQDPIKIISRPFEPKDFHNLPGIITTYLNAKARNHNSLRILDLRLVDITLSSCLLFKNTVLIFFKPFSLHASIRNQ